jgi:putative alpha-1,2-mannosidase
MVQLSPVTDTIGYWVEDHYNKKVYKYCSGYHYDDPTIVGFSHTHFSGNGKTLKIKVENQSPENVQVKEVRLNWKVLETPFVKFSELIGGGEMVLKMKKN